MSKWTMNKILWTVGIVGAIVIGFLTGAGIWVANEMILTVMVLVGLGIGLMNVSHAESTQFMLSVIVLITAGTGAAVFGGLGIIGGIIGGVLTYIGAVAVPAGIVIALKTFTKTAK